MPIGTIAKLTDKGFGFIALPHAVGARDLFFHSNELVGVSFDSLWEGDRVSFDIKQNPKGPYAGTVIRLLKKADFSASLDSLFSEPLPANIADDLFDATDGNPVIAGKLHDHWEATRIDLRELAGLLAPFSRSTFVDTKGGNLTPTNDSQAFATVCDINAELIPKISNDPLLIYQISPRAFEEIIAELFQRRGYSVTLTGATRDRGKDLYVARSDAFGKFIFAVECKRYAPNRRVGVEVVRGLSGVVHQERLNGGIIATTSGFTKDAKDFTRELKWQMQLKDYFDVIDWIRSY